MPPTAGPTLCLSQATVGKDQYRVELSISGGKLPAKKVTATFPFAISVQEREKLRWYLEDYLELFPDAPTRRAAARIEAQLHDLGSRLFAALFAGNDARNLWFQLAPRWSEVRVEVITDPETATALPWELLRDDERQIDLALGARAFVRSQFNQLEGAPSLTGKGPIRILLVICRPGGRADVPFRSVASRIIKSLTDEARAQFQLDVLRPPTWEQLDKVLRRAHRDGKPYHVVHFDGHGTFDDLAELFRQWQEQANEASKNKAPDPPVPGIDMDARRFSPRTRYPHRPRPGRHGYLVFENPDDPQNMRLVDGPELGRLLVTTGVPVLVLNACRSDHALRPPDPEQPDPPLEDSAPAQVHALGSLAQEVLDAGVPGVVAMRYNVWVVTAAQFVADLYGALADGATLGDAVAEGRRRLAADPFRVVGAEPLPLADWTVPIVYETQPLALFPKPKQARKLVVPIKEATATPERGVLDKALPAAPAIGFWGRDETLLALDRAFDQHRVVLLQGYAGSGKTTTAAEFARWYSLTGGVDGPVLFTSFEQYKTLTQVLNEGIGTLFYEPLRRAGVDWLALSDAQRREVTLNLLRQVPVLWLWDNVEPVAGFPTGTPSAWKDHEQAELLVFLRDAQATQAKVLLTSRRAEDDWLHDLPARVRIRPMPMHERAQLAEALASKYNRKLTPLADWQPLLEYSQGNPLTLIVVVGQALRQGLTGKDAIAAFVAQLRAGEQVLPDDDETEGRSKSLAASLSYGLEQSFPAPDRRRLALLHLFQGFVDVDALRVMGDPDADWCLEEVRSLTRADGLALLDRAAEIGLLTALGGGYYTIHPALPWYFRREFAAAYAADPLRPTGAFVAAVGYWGDYYHDQYEVGNRDVIGVLGAEEANLLHAWRLARAHGWWNRVIGPMQGLRQLYEHTGRRAEWAQLVAEVVPAVVDPATDGPLPGREAEWSLVTNYRVRLVRQARRWAEAERLQRAAVAGARQQAAPLLALPPETLDPAQRNTIRSLAASAHELGEILREGGQPECVAAYEESAALAHRVGDQAGEATATYNLGTAYKNIPAIRDLDRTEHAYRRSLELHTEQDRLSRSRCLHQLGMVAYERFQVAREAGQPDAEQLRLLNDSARLYHQALDLISPNAPTARAVTHNQLGILYADAGDLDQAVVHYREAIRYSEATGDLYEAAKVRYNVALAFTRGGRFPEALDYAQAALQNYGDFGEGAADMVERTQQLIAQIKQLQAQAGSP